MTRLKRANNRQRKGESIEGNINTSSNDCRQANRSDGNLGDDGKNGIAREADIFKAAQANSRSKAFTNPIAELHFSDGGYSVKYLCSPVQTRPCIAVCIIASQ